MKFFISEINKITRDSTLHKYRLMFTQLVYSIYLVTCNLQSTKNKYSVHPFPSQIKALISFSLAALFYCFQEFSTFQQTQQKNIEKVNKLLSNE